MVIMPEHVDALLAVIECNCHSDEEYTTLVGAMPHGLSDEARYRWLGRRAEEVIPARRELSSRLYAEIQAFLGCAVEVLPEGEVRRDGEALLARCRAQRDRLRAIDARRAGAS
jgi:hypothetical protein